jgi:hypothetical protein
MSSSSLAGSLGSGNVVRTHLKMRFTYESQPSAFNCSKRSRLLICLACSTKWSQDPQLEVGGHPLDGHILPHEVTVSLNTKLYTLTLNHSKPFP